MNRKILTKTQYNYLRRTGIIKFRTYNDYLANVGKRIIKTYLKEGTIDVYC